MRSSQGTVTIDLARIRANARAICAQTGVGLIAFIKADAYGLGAGEVAAALAPVAAGLATFSLEEVRAGELWQASGLTTLTLGPPDGLPAAYRRAHARPAVSSIGQARRYRSCRPVVCVDTGMRRFACPLDAVSRVVAAGGSTEVFTHAVTVAQARRLLTATRTLPVRRHAAASSLVGSPAAHLDAVRPGLLLYQDAVRVSAPLAAVMSSHGPIGYSAFRSARHGVILMGYAHGLRLGWCLVNGQRRRIREVGMQTSYVDAGERDAVGDEVVLLGGGLALDEVAASWSARPHEVLTTLCGAGQRRYLHRPRASGRRAP